MSPNGIVLTPIEQHRSLLNSIFKFKPISKLHAYITLRTGINKSLFTLAEILTILKDAIRGEGLYDEKNPSIILCSRDLEEALNMKALHVTEIRDLVLSHLIKLESDEFLKRHCDNVVPAPIANNTSSQDQLVSATQRLIQSARISTHVITDKYAKFTCKPKFLAVLRTLPETNKNKLVFTYEEATRLLSTYILKHKNRFFDNRNIKLAMVKGDLLGEAFGVSAFHRCQVNNFLRDQLIPYNPDDHPHTAVAGNGGSPNPISCGATTSANIAGPVTGLAEAATLPSADPCNRGVVRKRSESDSEDEQRYKQARTLDAAHYVTIKTGSLSDCETETIYNSQSRDTASNWSEGDQEEESDEFDEVDEYEPDSGEETERPPQAMGRQSVSNCTSDSDSEIDVDFKVMNIVMRKVEQKRETMYWGDDSGLETELDSNGLESESTDQGSCVTCGKPTSSCYRYCSSCWDIRRGWMAQHVRKRKKRREPKDAGHIKITETLREDSDAEIGGPQVRSRDSGIELKESQELVITTAKRATSAPNKQIEPAFNSGDAAPPCTEVAVRMDSSALHFSSQNTGHQNVSSLSATSQLCLLCCHRTKNASLVHGRIGHQVCCYSCAKKLWKKRADCPVCRRKVERVIKIIPA